MDAIYTQAVLVFLILNNFYISRRDFFMWVLYFQEILFHRNVEEKKQDGTEPLIYYSDNNTNITKVTSTI